MDTPQTVTTTRAPAVLTTWEQAMWLYEALEQNVGLDGWSGVDTPQTVMTTRAPAVLKTFFSCSVTCPNSADSLRVTCEVSAGERILLQKDNTRPLNKQTNQKTECLDMDQTYIVLF